MPPKLDYIQFQFARFDYLASHISICVPSGQRGIDPATRQDPSMMAMLLEMGFRDQRLNQRLLRKHGYSLLHTVNELVQMAEDSQSKAGNIQH